MSQYINQFSSAQESERVGISHRSRFISYVYMWMFIGLLVTGITALIVSRVPVLNNTIMGVRNSFGGFILIFIALMVLSHSIRSQAMKMNGSLAAGLFIIYSVIFGILMSYIFLYFSMASILNVFFMTSVAFFSVSVYGLVTKKNLNTMGAIATGILIGSLVMILIFFFFPTGIGFLLLNWLILVGSLIYTAYFTQKLMSMYDTATQGGNDSEKVIFSIAIVGALILYVSFINIFISLLNLFGRRN